MLTCYNHYTFIIFSFPYIGLVSAVIYVVYIYSY